MAQQVRVQHGVHEDMGSIPGLSQWVKDLALPQAAGYVTDVAQIWHCCGCGVGHQLQLQFHPKPQELPCATDVAIKKKN